VLFLVKNSGHANQEIIMGFVLDMLTAFSAKVYIMLKMFSLVSRIM
jgi:hypothetical protein